MRPIPIFPRSLWPSLLLCLACGDSTAASTHTTHAFVYGVITQNGQPAPGYWVYAKAHQTCETPVEQQEAAWPTEPESSDATGRYRIKLLSPQAPFTGCVYAHVLSKDTPARVLIAQRGAQVSFTPRRSGEPYDSTQVDFVLP